MKSTILVLSLPLAAALVLGGGEVSPQSGERTQKTQDSSAPELSVPSLAAFSVAESLQLPAADPAVFEVNVPIDGVERTLKLWRHSLRASNFKVLTQSDDGSLNEVEAPPSHTYRGTVQGIADSEVAASFFDGRFTATVNIGQDKTWFIEPLHILEPALPADGRYAIYQSDDVIAPAGTCGTEGFDPGIVYDDPPNDGGGGGQGGIAGTGLWRINLACDADFEYYSIDNGSSVSGTVDDIEQVINNVDFVYARDVEITYELSTIIVRTSSNDPYTTSNPSGLLCQTASTWNSGDEADIEKDATQLFTGKNLSGTPVGIAYTGTVCLTGGIQGCGTPSGDLAYSVVESGYTTSFPLRVAVSAHELGHNWNALHCSGSTCHIMCAAAGACGGVFGNDLKFGPVSINVIEDWRDDHLCDYMLPDPLTLPVADTFSEATLDPSLWTFVNGPMLSSLAENEPSPPLALRLEPSGDEPYQESDIRTNFMLLANAPESELTFFTQHQGVESGEQLFVDYLGASEDWFLLGVINSDGVDQETFTFQSFPLPGNAFHNDFRLRFRTNGDESDDAWYIDNVSLAEIEENDCPGDLNDSGAVDGADLGILLGNWNTSSEGDIDDNGTIDGADLGTLLGAWGACP